jgi:hypothetical protein
MMVPPPGLEPKAPAGKHLSLTAEGPNQGLCRGRTRTSLIVSGLEYANKSAQLLGHEAKGTCWGNLLATFLEVDRIIQMREPLPRVCAHGKPPGMEAVSPGARHRVPPGIRMPGLSLAGLRMMRYA